MLSNNYQNAINSLRNREAQPSFEEIRELVLAEKPKRKAFGLPIWTYLAGSAPIFLVLAIILLTSAMGSKQNLSHLTKLLPIKSFISQQKIITPQFLAVKSFASSSSPTETRDVLHVLESSENPIQLSERSKEKQSVPVPPKPTASSEVESVKTTDNKLDWSISPSDIASAEENISSTFHYSFFISAGIPASQWAFRFTDLLYGSVGIKKQLNSASTIAFELRRNTFLKKYTAHISSYHDTVLTVGGQTYHNSIGVFTSASAEMVNNVISFGVGYRLNFSRIGAFTPFGEFGLGASTQGALTSEILGIQYSLNSLISLEFLIRSDQLFSRGSSPQSSFNINVGASYPW